MAGSNDKLSELARIRTYRQAVEGAFERLLRKAHWVCVSTGLAEDPRAILNEAVEALFEGKCPDRVDPVAFVSKRILQIAGNRMRNENRRRVLAHRIAHDPADDALSLVDVPSDAKDDSLVPAVLAALDDLAGKNKDDGVQLVIMAICDVAKDDAEVTAAAVMAMSGMARPTYKAARARLTRLVRLLPEHLRERVSTLFEEGA